MANFYLGQLVATAGVAEAMRENPDFDAFVQASLRRYLECDGGELPESDKKQNDSAVKNGNDRILAAYKKQDGKAWKIWIITEWDHSATTILFPDEY